MSCLRLGQLFDREVGFKQIRGLDWGAVHG